MNPTKNNYIKSSKTKGNKMEYKSYSKDSTVSFCFGGFPTIELIKNRPGKLKEIVLSEKCENSAELQEILRFAKQKGIRVTTNGKLINKLSKKENVYILGIFEKYDDSIDSAQNTVLLVNPSDMGNLGTIIRVMLGFGYNNLAIIKPSVDIFDPKVIRSSMGAIFSMHVKLFDSFEDFEKINKSDKFPFMLQTDNALQNYTNIPTPHTLIFGNESRGLDDKYLSIGTPLRIIHSSKIDSLNLSMSVGIALYHFSKNSKNF